MPNQKHDITGGLIVGAAGITILATVALAFKYFFRNFTLRKESPVASPYRSDRRSKVAALTLTTPVAHTPLVDAIHMVSPKPVPVSDPDAGDVEYETSPIENSEATAELAALASEEALRDWLSPEEDEAWAHL